MFMHEDELHRRSEVESADDSGTDERHLYDPSLESQMDERPRTASMPVRPVSAKTYHKLLGIKADKKGATQVRMYNNDLYGDEGDVLAFEDDSDSDQITAVPGSTTPVLQTPKLQQQRSLAERRRMERMQGGIAVSNTSLASKGRPGSAFGRPGPAAAQKACATSSSGGAFDLNAMADSLSTAPSTSGRNGSETSTAPSEMAQRVTQGESSETARTLKERGIDTVFDPTGGIESIPLWTPSATSQPRLTLPENTTRQQMEAFLMTPGPRNHPFLCFIVRDRSESKVYPRYSLYVDEGGKFLMSARRRKKSKSSNYLISLDDEDLARQSEHYFGKVRSNFIGTEFVVYDKGKRGGRKKHDEEDDSGETREELAAVMYQHNVLGTRGPRKMTGLLPKLDSKDKRVALGSKPTMLEKYKADEDVDKMVVMKNKTPKWNDQLNAYCLNFKGRVTEASVKNFQLVTDEEPEHVILQFGKVGNDTFTMDYMSPICALQAFAICLTSFDNKLACE